jgi:hypothetical protein
MSEHGKMSEQPDGSELSQVYSTLARETVPPELDRKILGIAEANKPGILRKWSRPIALAATITVCFSLLLQLTDSPREKQLESRGARSLAPEQSTLDLPAAMPIDERGETVAAPRAAEEKAVRVPADSTAGASALSRVDMTDAAGGSAEQLMAIGSALSGSPCPAESRERPGPWWQCIADLREKGMNEEADIEQRLLGQAFPDFILPK